MDQYLFKNDVEIWEYLDIDILGNVASILNEQNWEDTPLEYHQKSNKFNT